MSENFGSGTSSFPPWVEELFENIGIKLLKLGDAKVALRCLDLFDDKVFGYPDAILLHDGSVSNYIILHHPVYEHYFLGFNDEGQIASKGIFGVARTAGSDFTLVHNQWVAIFKAKEVLDHLSFNWNGAWANQFLSGVVRPSNKRS